MQAIKLSFIGGLSGGIWYFVAYLSSSILPVLSLFFDVLFGGLLFTIVGAGVSIALILAVPELSSKKGKMLLGGVAAGFSAGLFFPLGIFLYIGIVILSAFIGITIRLLQVPKIALKISCGGILGGVAGALFITLPWLSLRLSFEYLSFEMQSRLSIITATVTSSMLIYSLTLGMLITARKR